MPTLGEMLYHHVPPKDWPVPKVEYYPYTERHVDELISELKLQMGREINDAYDDWVLEVIDEVYEKWCSKYKPVLGRSK